MSDRLQGCEFVTCQLISFLFRQKHIIVFMRLCTFLSSSECIVLRRGARKGTIVRTASVPKAILSRYSERTNRGIPMNSVRALNYNEFESPFWLARVIGRTAAPDRHLVGVEALCPWFDIRWVDTRYQDRYSFPAIDIAQNLIDEFSRKEKALSAMPPRKRKIPALTTSTPRKRRIVHTSVSGPVKRQLTSYNSIKQLHNPAKAKIRNIVSVNHSSTLREELPGSCSRMSRCPWFTSQTTRTRNQRESISPTGVLTS